MLRFTRTSLGPRPACVDEDELLPCARSQRDQSGGYSTYRLVIEWGIHTCKEVLLKAAVYQVPRLQSLGYDELTSDNIPICAHGYLWGADHYLLEGIT